MLPSTAVGSDAASSDIGSRQERGRGPLQRAERARQDASPSPERKLRPQARWCHSYPQPREGNRERCIGNNDQKDGFDHRLGCMPADAGRISFDLEALMATD